MTPADRIAYYRPLAADNRVLALDHTGTSKSLERIASEYDTMAAQLESELAQEQPKQEAGGGETAEFIHSQWVENPVALARLFRLLKLTFDKSYKKT